MIEITGKVYIDARHLNLGYVRNLLYDVEEMCANDGLIVTFRYLDRIEDTYTLGNVSVGFRMKFDERNTLIDFSDDYQIKKFVMSAFEYFMDDFDISPILVKDIQYYNDYFDDYYEEPKKKVSKPSAPPKEYTTKKSKHRVVFVLKEGVV
jgi:hypothetical protein